MYLINLTTNNSKSISKLLKIVFLLKSFKTITPTFTPVANDIFL